MIKGFKKYEGDELLQVYLLDGEAETTLELKENNFPIAYVESVEDGIQLTALLESDNQYFTSSQCQDRKPPRELKFRESCILKNKSFYYVNEGRKLKIELLLENDTKYKSLMVRMLGHRASSEIRGLAPN